jgi:hypothetical protein
MRLRYRINEMLRLHVSESYVTELIIILETSRSIQPTVNSHQKITSHQLTNNALNRMTIFLIETSPSQVIHTDRSYYLRYFLWNEYFRMHELIIW